MDLSPRARAAVAQLDRMAEVVKLLNDRAVADLDRCGRFETEDGFPKVSPGVTERVSGGSLSNPTVSAAGRKSKHDVVGETVDEAFVNIAALERLADRVLAQVRFVLADGTNRYLAQLVSTCGCCSRTLEPGDRLVSGYCSACHEVWVAGGRKDRYWFQQDAKLASALYKALVAAGPDGLTGTEQRDLFGRHQLKAEIDTARSWLEGVGLASTERVSAGGGPGRPAFVTRALSVSEGRSA